MTNTHSTVTAISAFNDNYIWAISSENSDKIALVDPGDANVCIDYLQRNDMTLSTILITHHHKDHVGGIKKLLGYAKKEAWSVTVYGPANERIDQLDITLKENDVVNLTAPMCQFTVLDLPGHTKGHIAYYNDAMVFCGDTLFSGGCGRVFEGTPKQMHHSLAKLATLTPETLVYCAHEYTQTNLAFALAVEPNNLDLQSYSEQVNAKRQKNQATIPTSIGLERRINPFLRCNEISIKLAAKSFNNQETNNSDEVFTVIRAWKDNF